MLMYVCMYVCESPLNYLEIPRGVISKHWVVVGTWKQIIHFTFRGSRMSRGGYIVPTNLRMI